jgi:hypothetical protein
MNDTADDALSIESDLTPLDICVDAWEPEEYFDPATAPDPSQPRPTSGNELALANEKRWQVGQTLSVWIMDGDAELRKTIERHAREWLEYANLEFVFRRSPDAEIRVTTLGMDYWSKIGNAAASVASDKPTMSLAGPRGDLALEDDPAKVRRAVLHEFGHAIGLIHEHLRPEVPIPWNPAKVYIYYRRRGWSREMVDRNIFQRYAPFELTESARYDTSSIMQYPVPKEHTDGVYQIPWNLELSEMDKAFIAELYPR